MSGGTVAQTSLGRVDMNNVRCGGMSSGSQSWPWYVWVSPLHSSGCNWSTYCSMASDWVDQCCTNLLTGASRWNFVDIQENGVVVTLLKCPIQSPATEQPLERVEMLLSAGRRMDVLLSLLLWSDGKLEHMLCIIFTNTFTPSSTRVAC